MTSFTNRQQNNPKTDLANPERRRFTAYNYSGWQSELSTGSLGGGIPWTEKSNDNWWLHLYQLMMHFSDKLQFYTQASLFLLLQFYPETTGLHVIRCVSDWKSKHFQMHDVGGLFSKIRKAKIAKTLSSLSKDKICRNKKHKTRNYFPVAPNWWDIYQVLPQRDWRWQRWQSVQHSD